MACSQTISVGALVPCNAGSCFCSFVEGLDFALGEEYILVPCVQENCSCFVSLSAVFLEASKPMDGQLSSLCSGIGADSLAQSLNSNIN